MSEEQATEAVEENVSREAPVVTSERPDYIPEKFWNAEEGQVNLDDLAKSYNNLEKFATGKQEEMRESILSELETEASEGLPEEYVLPKLVEGITEEMVNSNPMTEWWGGKCKELGLPQEMYEEGINTWIDTIMGSAPNIEEEMSKLGENSQDRINAVTGFAQANFPPEEMELIASTLGTSALGVSALERIMEMQKSRVGRSAEVAQPEHELTVADVKTMMNDKRYYSNKDRDPSYVAQVDSAWQRLNNAGKV